MIGNNIVVPVLPIVCFRKKKQSFRTSFYWRFLMYLVFRSSYCNGRDRIFFFYARMFTYYERLWFPVNRIIIVKRISPCIRTPVSTISSVTGFTNGIIIRSYVFTTSRPLNDPFGHVQNVTYHVFRRQNDLYARWKCFTIQGVRIRG